MTLLEALQVISKLITEVPELAELISHPEMPIAKKVGELMNLEELKAATEAD